MDGTDLVIPVDTVSHERIADLSVATYLRMGVHAPTKSVSVPVAISVVLIFHVSLWPGSTRGRHDKVIATTTDMSA